jgi:hypothetical protein
MLFLEIDLEHTAVSIVQQKTSEAGRVPDHEKTSEGGGRQEIHLPDELIRIFDNNLSKNFEIPQVTAETMAIAGHLVDPLIERQKEFPRRPWVPFRTIGDSKEISSKIYQESISGSQRRLRPVPGIAMEPRTQHTR